MKKGRKWSKLVLTITIGVSSFVVPAGSEVQASSVSTNEIYVSPQGADSNDGSPAAPFATLEGARDAIRTIKAADGLPAGGITVYLREGHYSISESFELTAQDSGTVDSPIVYRSYPNEEAVLVGGVRLDGSQFDTISDTAVWNRLQPAVRDQVLEYDLSAHGTMDYGAHMQVGFGFPGPHYNPPAELFVDAEPFRLARWPDQGFVTIGAADQPASGTSFEYLDPRPESWADLTDVWMYGYMRWDWADGNLKLDAIDSATKRIMSNQITAFAEVKTGQRYYYYNVLEELDVPGEWYLDRTANKLYAYLPLAGSPSDMDMYLSLLNEPMVTLNQASHIAFQGLSFEASRDIGVVVNGGSSVVLDDNIFRNLGNIALSIDGGQDHIVIDNQIYNTGYGAIYLHGGDRTTLTPSNFNVVNNEIYNFSRIQATYSPGVELRGVGHRFAHNEIYDGPHMAIWIHGNNHVIEYNEIYDVLKTTSDAGAMYMGSDWAEQGTVIRYNYLHNLYGVSGIGQIGVYLDDMASGSLVYGNVIEKAHTGMLIGGGRNQMIANNIVMDGKYSIRMDDRGVTWAFGACAPNGLLHSKLQQLPIQSEPWASRYSTLTTLWGDTPCLPKYNTLQDNVYQQNEELIIDPSVTTYGYIHSNWVTNEDPGFVDKPGKDFTLVQNAPVFTELPRFNPIPFAQMGLRQDPWTYLEDSPLASVQLIASAKMRVDDVLQPWVMADSATGILMDLFGSVSFTSSDPSIATVHATNGTVTAVAPGTATITVTGVKDGVSRSDSAQIEVVGVYLDSVALQVTPQPLIAGQTSQARVTGVLTNNDPADMDAAMMTYTSSDTAIAEIDPDGVIMAKQAGNVVLTVNAMLLGVEKQASLSLTVYPEGSNLKAPWTIVNYGSTEGYVAEKDGTFTIRTNGANVWGTADAFTYVYRNVDLNEIEGEFEISTKVHSLDNTHPDAASGIMIRDRDSTNAKQVNLRVLPDGVLRFVFREEEGGESDYAFPANPIPLPTELKLTKNGDLFEAYYKQNNAWVSFAQAEVEMDDEVLAGIMTFSHANAFATSVQSDVHMTEANKIPTTPTTP
ncbi:right-handed parallel beta-helix repeat-containing protein, partial [Paenibacillus sp. 598K]|uniref:right-handed parallel beta-helix repeat-containing protein n=1 Tax=Paenibacillus sp. 598K TaxID=1117987 RepID=UPI0016244A72